MDDDADVESTLLAADPRSTAGGAEQRASARDADVNPLLTRRARVIIFTVLSLALFYFVGKSLAQGLREIPWKNLSFSGWALTCSLGCLLTMRVLNGVCCRLIFRSLGSRLGLRWMTGAVWVSSMGRYVPGKVASGIGLTLLLTRRGVALASAVAGTFLFTAMTVLVGLMMAAPLLLMADVRQKLPYFWVPALGAILAGIVALHPRVFATLSNIALGCLGRERLPASPAIKPYATATALVVLRALLMGAAAWFAARAFAPAVSPRQYPLILGATSLAAVTGFLAVFVPAGLGVQEGVFLIVLAPLLGPSAALLAVLFRTLQVTSDLLAGAAGLVILHPRIAGTMRAVGIDGETLGLANPPARDLADTVLHYPPTDEERLALPPVTPVPRLLMEMPNKPNFFIIGAAKCGTTALYEYLSQHPQVFMSPHKEPHFFARDFEFPPEWCIRDEAQYVRLFAKSDGAECIGEASVWYIYSQVAARELIEFSPDARIIAMLRDPIDMMYSLHGQFLWNCNDDIIDFEEALAAQGDRSRGMRIPGEAHAPAALQYTKVASFSSQIRRYFDVFGRDRVHIVLFDDLVRDTPGEYKKVLEHLGLDGGFAPDFRIVNPAKPITPRFNRFFARRPWTRRALHTILPSRLIRQINYALPYIMQTVQRPNKIDAQLRKRLLPLFAREIELLEELIGRDLSAWKR